MDLFYRKFGKESDQPIVVLHGLFGISDNWVTYGKQMASEGFEVFIPDQRNHGRSEHSDDFNYLALTNDLYDFIDFEDLENPILIGHSMGGKVAMRFAVDYPDLVQKLIIVDIAPKVYGARNHHLNIIESMLKIDLEKIKSRAEAETKLEERITDRRIRQFILKNLHRTRKDSFEWRLNIEAIANNLDQMFDGIPKESKYSNPSLFIKGGNSDYILPKDHQQIITHFPEAEIITINNASHWVHADAPKEFFELSRSFLMK